MEQLDTGIVSIIALWLGHGQLETTQIYLHADLLLKDPAKRLSSPSSFRFSLRKHNSGTLATSICWNS